jgi:PAS domain-containing protein
MTTNGAESDRRTNWLAFETRWHELLGMIPAATYTCDASGLITYFNPLASAVWGRTPKLRDPSERYCGSHRLYLSDGTALSHEQCWMALAIQNGQPYLGRAIVIERPDGQRTVGEAYAHPLRNDRGDLVGAVNFVADVTALERPASALPKVGYSSLPRDAVLAMIEVALSLPTRMAFERG